MPEPEDSYSTRRRERRYMDTLRRGGNVNPMLTSTFGDLFSERRNLRGTPYFIGPRPSTSEPFGTRQGEPLARRDAIGDVIAGPGGHMGEPEGYDRPRGLFGTGATPTEQQNLGYNPAEFGSRPQQSFALPSGGSFSVASRVDPKLMAQYFSRPSGPMQGQFKDGQVKYQGERPSLQDLLRSRESTNAPLTQTPQNSTVTPVSNNLPSNPFTPPTQAFAPSTQSSNEPTPNMIRPGDKELALLKTLGRGLGQGLFPSIFGFPEGTPGANRFRPY